MKEKQKKFLINLLQNAKFAYNPVAIVTEILILTKCRNNFKLIVDKWSREDWWIIKKPKLIPNSDFINSKSKKINSIKHLCQIVSYCIVPNPLCCVKELLTISLNFVSAKCCRVGRESRADTNWGEPGELAWSDGAEKLRGGETGEMSPDFMDWLHFKCSVQIGRDVKGITFVHLMLNKTTNTGH